MSLTFEKGKGLLTMKGILAVGAFISIIVMYIILNREISSLRRQSPLTASHFIYSNSRVQGSADSFLSHRQVFNLLRSDEDEEYIDTVVYDDSFLIPGEIRIVTNKTLREKPQISDIYRDALYSLSGEVELNGLDDEFTVHQDHELLLYEGNRRVHKSFSPTPILPSSSTNYDVTIISQTSLERLFCLSYMLRRWKGPISVAVYHTDEESSIFENYVKNTPLPHRLRILQYRVLPPSRSQHHCIVYYDEVSSTDGDSSDLFHSIDQWGNHHSFVRRCDNYKEQIYPINRLRNLAIQNILTTHFLVLDMDMWPISTAYQDFITLPSSILRNEHLALIIPAFSLKSSAVDDCSGFQDCVEKAMQILPQNKKELKECIDKDECTTFRPETQTHNYMVDGWYTFPPSVRFMFKNCFNHVFQEPYLAVRRSAHLPLFDERFVNYGYNKVQWVEHLRWIGYQFAVLGQSFAVDIPHPASDYAKRWTKMWETKNNANITMRAVYRKFLTELRSSTNDDSTVFVCYRYKNRFTKNIAVNYQDMKDYKSRISEAKEAAKANSKASDKEEKSKPVQPDKRHDDPSETQQSDNRVKPRKKIVFRTIRSKGSNKVHTSYE